VIADQFDLLDASCEAALVRRAVLITPSTGDSTENRTESPAEDRKES